MSESLDDDLNEPLIRVVCAAIRSDGEIICGARHYDGVMRCAIVREIPPGQWSNRHPWYSAEQGFISNKGEYLTRSQAWIIARKAGQIRCLVGSQTDSETGELFSENLY